MKNATLIIATLVFISQGVLRADSNPVHLLPGMMTANATPGALPQALISDLTNAPNPFDSRRSGLAGETQISYQLLKDAEVSIALYDLLGHRVRGWDFTAGASGGRQGLNAFVWDGTNEAGQKVSKGGYLAEIVIETPETTVTAVRKIGVIH